LPLIETHIIGTHPVDALRILFMAGTIAVGVLNYLPTRVGSVAFLMMIIMAGEIACLYDRAGMADYATSFDWLLTSVPWIAWLCFTTRRHAGRSEFDELWLSFRDRWGLVWSQRVREQFNNAALHAGWPITLRWRGLTQIDSAPLQRSDHVETLRATMQRFLRTD
jgi:hypothetical protein